MYGNIIEWDRQPWVAANWRGIDQAPVFLASLQPGEEVLALAGDHVTTQGIHGVGPIAAAPFTLRLIDALCGSGPAELDVDLVSRAGMRTDELTAMVESLNLSGMARRTADAHWVCSVEAGSPLQKAVGLLVGSNLDYVITLGDLRLAERDATILLVAGAPAAIDRAWSAVEQTAQGTGMELKPLGWDV